MNDLWPGLSDGTITLDLVFLFYFLSFMTVLTFGAGYCAAVILDFADLYYYYLAADLSFEKDKLPYMILHLVDFASQVSADGYTCVTLAMDNVWWEPENTGILYYMEERHAFSFDAWPDLNYTLSALIHIFQLSSFKMSDKRLIQVEVPRALAVDWKLIYKLFS